MILAKRPSRTTVTFGMFAVLERIVDQVRRAAPQGLTLHAHRDGVRRFDNDLSGIDAACARGSGRRVARQIAEFRHGVLFAAFAAREIQIFVQHVFHLDDVGAHRLDVGRLAHHGELELHARQRRLQVVTDARQHLGALLHMAFDAFAHGDERRARRGALRSRHRV